MEILLLFVPIIAFAVAQGTKILIKTYKEPFKLSHLAAYGGMPSGHTALTTSAAITAGLYAGWNSPVFVVAVVLLIVIIRDALGLRMHLSEHSKALNKIVKESKDIDKNGYKHLGERLGHTPAEVIGGVVVGILVALISYWMF